MDLDHDGLIEFSEWVKYLMSSTDPTDVHLYIGLFIFQANHNDVFNLDLKRKFDIYDVNSDGVISL